MLFEKVEEEVNRRNFESVPVLLEKVGPAESKKTGVRLTKIKCAYFEFIGNIQLLYQTLCQFLLIQFEERRPAEISWLLPSRFVMPKVT